MVQCFEECQDIPPALKDTRALFYNEEKGTTFSFLWI